MYGQNKADNALDKVGSEVIVAVADKTLAAVLSDFHANNP